MLLEQFCQNNVFGKNILRKNNVGTCIIITNVSPTNVRINLVRTKIRVIGVTTNVVRMNGGAISIRTRAVRTNIRAIGITTNVFRAKALRANVVGANGRITNIMGRICVFIKKSLQQMQFGPMSLEQMLQHCIQTIKTYF